MATHKIDRISEDVRRELTDIFRILKDPRITGMLSIVHVEVTNDLSLAKVHVSSLDGLDAAKNAVKGLKNASGFIRHEIAQRLNLRHAPELVFVADDSIETGAEISRLIEQIKKKDGGLDENND